MSLRIRVLSDIHVEYGFDYTQIKGLGEDVLILAGDIGCGVSQVLKALTYVSSEFKHVIYVPGNHEFYGADIAEMVESLTEAINPLLNVHLLDTSSVCIEGVLFIGATLWSDFNKGDFFTMQSCQRQIADFKYIYKDGSLITPSAMRELFARSVDFIKSEIASNLDKQCVVVTHFLPSLSCINEKYDKSSDITHYYATELGNDIAYFDNVPYWVFGHSHDACDIMINSTRCISNPYGYNHVVKAKGIDITPTLTYSIVLDTCK